MALFIMYRQNDEVVISISNGSLKVIEDYS